MYIESEKECTEGYTFDNQKLYEADTFTTSISDFQYQRKINKTAAKQRRVAHLFQSLCITTIWNMYNDM